MTDRVAPRTAAGRELLNTSLFEHPKDKAWTADRILAIEAEAASPVRSGEQDSDELRKAVAQALLDAYNHGVHEDRYDYEAAARALLSAGDKALHRRSAPQDYDPTPTCTGCGKHWDETGGFLAEFSCPESPGHKLAPPSAGDNAEAPPTDAELNLAVVLASIGPWTRFETSGQFAKAIVAEWNRQFAARAGTS